MQKSTQAINCTDWSFSQSENLHVISTPFKKQNIISIAKRSLCGPSSLYALVRRVTAVLLSSTKVGFSWNHVVSTMLPFGSCCLRSHFQSSMLLCRGVVIDFHCCISLFYEYIIIYAIDPFYWWWTLGLFSKLVLLRTFPYMPFVVFVHFCWL